MAGSPVLKDLEGLTDQLSPFLRLPSLMTNPSEKAQAGSDLGAVLAQGRASKGECLGHQRIGLTQQTQSVIALGHDRHHLGLQLGLVGVKGIQRGALTVQQRPRRD